MVKRAAACPRVGTPVNARAGFAHRQTRGNTTSAWPDRAPCRAVGRSYPLPLFHSAHAIGGLNELYILALAGVGTVAGRRFDGLKPSRTAGQRKVCGCPIITLHIHAAIAYGRDSHDIAKLRKAGRSCAYDLQPITNFHLVEFDHDLSCPSLCSEMWSQRASARSRSTTAAVSSTMSFSSGLGMVTSDIPALLTAGGGSGAVFNEPEL